MTEKDAAERELAGQHPRTDDLSRCFHAFSGGSMPTHVAVGLLRLAQVTLEQTEAE